MCNGLCTRSCDKAGDLGEVGKAPNRRSEGRGSKAARACGEENWPRHVLIVKAANN